MIQHLCRVDIYAIRAPAVRGLRRGQGTEGSGGVENPSLAETGDTGHAFRDC